MRLTHFFLISFDNILIIRSIHAFSARRHTFLKGEKHESARCGKEIAEGKGVHREANLKEAGCRNRLTTDKPLA